MMHARSLVRRLLSLRNGCKLLLDGRMNTSEQDQRHTQARCDSDFRRAALAAIGAQGDGGPSVDNPNIHKDLSDLGLDQKWVGHQHVFGPDQYTPAYAAFLATLSHSAPLDELNQQLAGQAAMLSSGAGK